MVRKRAFLAVFLLFAMSIFLLINVSVKADCIGATYNFTCGDTINESCTFNESMTCNSANAFTINADNVIVDGAGYSFIGDGTNTGFAFTSFNANNFTIDNLSITNFSYGMNWGNNNNLTIKNSQIFNNTNTGIVTDYTTDLFIFNNLFYNNTYYGLSFGQENQGGYIYNNTFDNAGLTFQIWLGSRNMYIYNNTFLNHQGDGLILNSKNTDGIIQIYDNFANNSNFAYCTELNTNTQIYNNTQYGGNFLNCLDGRNVEAMNNSFYGNTIAYFGLNENISLHDNYFDDQNTAGNGITLDGNIKKNLSIKNNYFFNVSDAAVGSSDTPCDAGLPCIIEGNTFNISKMDFIFLIGANSTVTSRNFIIRNNLFIDHNIDNAINDLAAFKVWYVSNLTAYNNTIIRGHDQGIWAWGMENSEIYNNTVIDCDCMPYQTERSNYNNYWHDNYARNTTQAMVGLWFDDSNNTYRNFIGDNVRGCVQVFGRLTYNNTFENFVCTALNSSDSNNIGIYINYLVDDWSGEGYPNNNTFKNFTVSNYYEGITVLDGGENNTVIGSSIINPTFLNLHLYNSAVPEPNISLTLLNVSFNKSNVTVTKGVYYNQYYLDVYVNDTGGNPVDGAFVIAYDNTNASTFNVTTNSSGYIARQNVTEYFQNATDSYYLTNYSVNATNGTYNSEKELLNLTTNAISDDGTNIYLTLLPTPSPGGNNAHGEESENQTNVTTSVLPTQPDSSLIDYRLGNLGGNANGGAFSGLLNQTFSFTVKGVLHTGRIVDITSNRITLWLWSNPIQVIMNVGESKSVDIDGDGKSDITLTLNSIKDSIANINIKEITLQTQPTNQTNQNQTQNIAPVQQKTNYFWAYIALGILGLLIILALIFSRRRKRHRY